MTSRGLAILGGGNMGGALVRGLLRARECAPRDIVVAERDVPQGKNLGRETRVRVVTRVEEAVADRTTWVLAVKPQQMDEVLKAVAPVRKKGPLLVISVAAGIPTVSLEKALPGAAVIRAMPNTPALVGAGAMVYCSGKKVRPTDESRAKRILAALGPVWKVEEKHMDTVTALSGSGPAYVFALAEWMAAAGAALGLAPDLAESLARQTVFGAGRLLAETVTPAAELRQRVTSPGGTTQAALTVLEQAGVKRIFQRALGAARRRSRELSSPRRS